MGCSSAGLVPIGALPPSLLVYIDPPGGTAPLPVEISQTIETHDSSTPQVEIDFGDGQQTSHTIADAVTGHTYQNPGSYTLEITVTDGRGLESQGRYTITVD